MPFLIAGLLLFWLASVGLKMFVRASPAVLAQRLRQAGSVAFFGLAVLLLLRGRVDVALVLAGVGYWFGRGMPSMGFRSSRQGAARPARMSRVRSAMIEMALDHGSGLMTGMVLAGPEEGSLLDQMSRSRCLALYGVCLRDDPEGASLLEAYLDRRFPRWRQAGNDGGDPGTAGRSGRSGGRPGAMSEDEAHEVLGLSKSATREDIARAHRTLMKRFHPDHGGPTDLAARVNEAKDVLMRRHP